VTIHIGDVQSLIAIKTQAERPAKTRQLDAPPMFTSLDCHVFLCALCV